MDPSSTQWNKIENAMYLDSTRMNLFDTSFEIAKVVLKLCESGHPKFQSNLLAIDCRVKVMDLMKTLRNHEELLQRTSHPILSFLSYSQLVSCLKSQDVSMIFSTLLSIGCNPVLMHESWSSHCTSQKN
eukprot:TRINITY_DN1328_c1_g1_i2.p1 TRINITY_DN1328_c1_g1~~TRINITY_DN1328_c1_g1_i2.p1  ORF type:complete len:129 (-),score=15.97 TRINITY_DN1328_c1_g1_i2:1101-1487(-)